MKRGEQKWYGHFGKDSQGCRIGTESLDPRKKRKITRKSRRKRNKSKQRSMRGDESLARSKFRVVDPPHAKTEMQWID